MFMKATHLKYGYTLYSELTFRGITVFGVEVFLKVEVERSKRSGKS